MSNLNRRDFLKLAGKVTLGAAAVSALPAVASAEKYVAPAWPWTYPAGGLDVATVQKYVFEHFSTDGGCCAGAVGGFLAALSEVDPEGPYKVIDSRMFAHGAGGYGNKNLCGALGGSFAVFGLFLPGADANKLRGQLYAWYKETALPIYLPEGAEPHPAQSVAGSELCRDSYGNWNAKTGLEFGDPIRINRCRCLTADTAGKACELLNAHFAALAAPAVEEPAPELAANEYIGVGKSDIGGEIKVKVTMDGDKISKIEVLSNNETPSFFEKVNPSLLDAMVAANSTNVDTVAGATCSSKGLIEAVNNALAQIKK